jgi:hypothetical protein
MEIFLQMGLDRQITDLPGRAKSVLGAKVRHRPLKMSAQRQTGSHQTEVKRRF